VVTRSAVLITNARLCAPPLRLGIDEPFGKVHWAPVGSPEPQLSATVLGMLPVGVTVAFTIAGAPATTGGGALGDTVRLKSLTVAVALVLWLVRRIWALSVS
jgi:hypothetical protein